MTDADNSQVNFPGILIAGIGNYYRADDGVGPRVADAVADITGIKNIGPISEPLDLIGKFDNAKLAILVDAMRSSSPPGTIKIFDMNVAEVRTQTTSTHGINLERTISLAAALGKAPEKAIVVGIEGKLFGDGDKLSPEVADAVVDAVKMIDQIVLSELKQCDTACLNIIRYKDISNKYYAFYEK